MSSETITNAVLASLARHMKESRDPVFGAPNRKRVKLAQAAYFKFKNKQPTDIKDLLLRPYRKSTGKAVISQRESARCMQLLQHDPQAFRKLYRLIARAQGADKLISKALAYYLGEMLERSDPTETHDEVPLLSPYCYAYRRTTGVQQALTHLEDWTYNAGLEWVARTDIVSFFDRIDRSKLHKQLRNLFDHLSLQDDHALNWIMALAGAPMRLSWKVVAGGAPNKEDRQRLFEPSLKLDNTYGIPQGNPLSAPLSNLFLTEVDKQMTQTPGYLRYADDIVICAESQQKADQSLAKLTQLLSELGLETNASKTSVDCIKSGQVRFLGFHYLEGRNGKMIAADKIEKFRQRIKHLTSEKHVQSLKVENDDGRIAHVIRAINLRVLVTRDGNKQGENPIYRLSPRSFAAHYSHNNEPAILAQMQELDLFIKYRIAHCLTPAQARNGSCVNQFFNEILPARNRRVVEAKGRAIHLLPLAGVFRKLPRIINAGSYGVEN